MPPRAFVKNLFCFLKQELRAGGKVKSYKAHNELVKQIYFLSDRQLILSCSRDKKFSLFCEDYSGVSEPFIISLSSGVNSVTYSNTLKIIATGSEDGVVRIFSQFSMKMPQMELSGHRSAVVAVDVLNVPFSHCPILVSFSQDVEIRAWDPVNFVCLQSVYLRFPRSASIICKTPEFSQQPLIIHQPQYSNLILKENPTKRKSVKSPLNFTKSTTTDEEANENSAGENKEGFIIVLYCNSYAKLNLERDSSHWPFDFEDFISDFEQFSTSDGIQIYKPPRFRKKKQKNQLNPKDPKSVELTTEEISQIDIKAKDIQKDLMQLKNNGKGSANFLSPKKSNLSYNGTKTFCEFDIKTPYVDRMLKRNASMFDKIPFYEIQDPIAPPSPTSFLNMKDDDSLPIKSKHASHSAHN